MIDPRYSMLQQSMTPDQNTYPGMQSPQSAYPSMQSAQNDVMPYNTSTLPQQMPSNQGEAALYPYENQQIPSGYQQGYKTGGEVKKAGKKGKKQENDNLYPLLAQLVKSQGNDEDSILAHINPIEAQILGLVSGGGSINPKTGLPQFSFLTKPGKALKNTFKNPKRLLADTVGAGGALLGAMTGNPFIGGAIGGGARSVIRGKGENPLLGALKGGGYGMGVSAIGSGLSALGSTSVGPTLSGQGSLSAYNLSNLGAAKGAGVAAGDEANDKLIQALGGTPEKTPPLGFIDKLKDSLTNPQTLIALGGLGLQGYGAYQASKPVKSKSPEELAMEQKRAVKAARLTAEEMDELLAYEELMEDKKNKKKSASSANSANHKPVYRKQHTPAEAQATGKWFSYYDNPNFHGAPLYADGGDVSPVMDRMMEPRASMYLEGGTGGQDDKIPAYLSDGEYVIDASTVADLGDGNNKAGAMKLDQMVKNVRKHKGGSINLPPKAKSLIDYMR